MPIEEFYARSETPVVVFTQRTIQFSASLVEERNLAGHNYVRIAVDEELRRIYFGFEEQSDKGTTPPGCQKFYSAKKSKRRMFAAGKLYSDHTWIKDARHRDIAKRRFELRDVDKADADLHSRYQYYIDVGYTFIKNPLAILDTDSFPEEPGVYRLWKDGRIVRIGQSNNIASRLPEHCKEFETAIDEFDYMIIPNEKDRRKEEKRLMAEFKNSRGGLPELNPIAT